MSRSALTLIELLVVMAVIAVVIAILLPALAGAKEAGSIAFCLANLKAISTTALMYSNDNDTSGYGNLPTQPWHLGFRYGGLACNRVSNLIYGGFRPGVSPPPEDADIDVYRYPTEWRPYNMYLAPGNQGSAPIESYVCKSDEGLAIHWILTGAPSTEPLASWQARGNSYGINWCWTESPTCGSGSYLEQLPELSAAGSAMLREKTGRGAAEFILFAEGRLFALMHAARPPGHSEPSPFPLATGWHRKFSTYTAGFYDGHAAFSFIDTRYPRQPGYNIWPGP